MTKDLDVDDEAGIGARSLTPHDPLTGFGNRHKLLTDLETAVAPGSPRSVLVIFDLGGLKQYQRVCGYNAGELVITRTAAVLKTIIGRAGDCYRPREDEYVLLLEGEQASLEPLLTAAASALRQEGEPFLITSSYAIAQLPDEAGEPLAALALADKRLRTITNRPSRERRQHPRNRDNHQPTPPSTQQAPTQPRS